jgi:hypothetical protein
VWPHGDVGALAFRVRRTVRGRWIATVAVALSVALVAAVVLALVAGARRTADAPDAYTRSVGGDVDAMLQQPFGAPRTVEVGRLSSVRAISGMTFVFGEIDDPRHREANGSFVFSGRRPLTARLVAGRTPRPSDATEFVADRTFVRQHDARLGSTFAFRSWSRAQGENGQAYNGPANGPSFRAHLVGIIETPDILSDQETLTVFSPALLRRDIASVATVMSVRLRDGATTKDLRAQLDHLAGGSAISVQSGQVVSAGIRTAVDAQARGIEIMALVAVIAAVVVLGQLLSRHAQLTAADRRPLAGLGMTPIQLTLETVTRAAIPAATGIVAGAALAVAVSGHFPTGFVRALEPRPGVKADWTTLGLGALLLFVAFVGFVALATTIGSRVRLPRSPAHATESLARRAPGITAATGTRFALTSPSGATRPVVGTLVALALTMTALVGAAAFGASLDRLVTHQDRYGYDFQAAVGDLADLSPAQLRARLEPDDDLAGLVLLTSGAARVGGRTIGLVGTESVRGDLLPKVLSGRNPTSTDEVALGRLTAHDLGVHVGDTVRIVGDARKAPPPLRVVGLVVVPPVGGVDGVGQGAVLTAAGFARVVRTPDTVLAGFTLQPGAGRGALRRVARSVHQVPGEQSTPTVIANVARVRRIPVALALLLAALAVLTLVHALVVAIRSRHHDVAILRALGAPQRWVGHVVHWQASVLAIVPLVVGVPLGIVVGASVFRAFAESIGVVPDPSRPFAPALVLVAVVLAIANVAAILPARRARRINAARALQAE